MDDRLNRQSWLDAGLKRLASHGADGVRIMAIAQQLGVTKGSFYWHFKDQSQYLDALLDEWEGSHTQQIIEHVERIGGEPSAKLRNLMSVTVAADPHLDQAVRSWANTSPVVGTAVKRVDKKRLIYLAGLIRELGWPQENAGTLARWSYGALIGQFSLRGPQLTERQIDLILGTVAFRPSSASE